jgi:hypothetical protein
MEDIKRSIEIMSSIIERNDNNKYLNDVWDVHSILWGVKDDDIRSYTYTLDEIETIVEFETNTKAYFLTILEYDVYKDVLNKYTDFDIFRIHVQTSFKYCEKPDINTVIEYWNIDVVENVVENDVLSVFSEYIIDQLSSDITIVNMLNEKLINSINTYDGECWYLIISMITTTRTADINKIKMLLKHIVLTDFFTNDDYVVLKTVLNKYFTVDEIVKYMSVQPCHVPILYRYIKEHPGHTYILENFSDGIFLCDHTVPDIVIGKKHIKYHDEMPANIYGIDRYNIYKVGYFIDNNPLRVYIDNIKKIINTMHDAFDIENVLFNKELMIEYMNPSVEIFTQQYKKYKLRTHKLKKILLNKTFLQILDRELLMVIISKLNRVAKNTYTQFELIINNIP